MRRRVLATLVSIFAVALLAAGLAASFFEDSGGYKISPEMKPAAPRAPDPAQTEAKVPNQQAAAQQTAPRAMPPAVTPARFKFRPDEPALVAEGKRLYGVHCASCHGVKLEGQPNWKQRNEDGKLPAPPHLAPSRRHAVRADQVWPVADQRGAVGNAGLCRGADG